MSKNIIAILILICGAPQLYAQGNWGVRVNQNTDFFSVESKGSKVQFARISAGVSYVTKKYTHDLELFVPTVKGSSPTFPWRYDKFENVLFTQRFSSYSMRYSVVRNFQVNNSFYFVLGGALNPYYLKVERLPTNENIAYYNYENFVGVSLNVVPGIKVIATKNLSFVLDCPLKLFDYYHKVYDVKNPAIPVRQQKMPSDHAKFFMNAFTIRLGASYVFGK